MRTEGVDECLQGDFGLGLAEHGDREEGVVGSDRIVGFGTTVSAADRVEARSHQLGGALQWPRPRDHDSQIHADGHDVAVITHFDGQSGRVVDHSVDARLSQVEE